MFHFSYIFFYLYFFIIHIFNSIGDVFIYNVNVWHNYLIGHSLLNFHPQIGSSFTHSRHKFLGLHNSFCLQRCARDFSCIDCWFKAGHVNILLSDPCLCIWACQHLQNTEKYRHNFQPISDTKIAHIDLGKKKKSSWNCLNIYLNISFHFTLTEGKVISF